MKKLVLTQREVILLPVEDESMHQAIMKAKFTEKGFDLTKPIHKDVNMDNGDIIYTQDE